MRASFILACVAVFFITLPGIAQKRQVKLNLEVGKTYKLDLNNSNIITKTFDKEPETSNTIGDLRMSFLVKNVKKGVIEMDVRILRQTIIMYSDKGMNFFAAADAELSSANDDKGEENVVSEILRDVVNKPFQIRMDENGEILEVKKYQELWENAVQKFENTHKKPLDDLVAKVLIENMKAPETFKANLDQLFSFYPGKTVSEGIAWSKPYEVGAIYFQIPLEMKYKVTQVTVKTSTIEGNGLAVIRNKEVDIPGSTKVLFDLSGTISLTLDIDNKSGWILSGIQKRKFSGLIRATGLQVPLTISGGLGVNILDKKK